MAFPFGFGLSYTTFALSDLNVSARGTVGRRHLAATVTVTVTNTGERGRARRSCRSTCGTSSHPLRRPVRELKGFTKV